MTAVRPLDRARENATGIVSMLVTGTWLAALLSGQDWWLPFMLFGYVVLVPLTALLFGDDDQVREWWDDKWTESEETTTSTDNEVEDDALATLRDRYARGELTDEQFERKLDRLLAVETLEDLEDRERDVLSERE